MQATAILSVFENKIMGGHSIYDHESAWEIWVRGGAKVLIYPSSQSSTDF